MTMKNSSQYFFIGVLLIIGLGFFPAYSTAQDAAPGDVPGGIPLLEGAGFAKKQYLVQLSGTIMNETFSGAQALLTISGPLRPGRRYNNPYLMIIEGFPKRNSINSFYWDSEDSEMWALANEITCDIKRTFVKLTHNYFYSLSPELLKHTGVTDTKVGKAEGIKGGERVALPTLVNARAGQLKLRIYSNSVSGTVWMKGYDPVERSYVLYSARLHGQKAYGLKPRQDQKKQTTGRE